MVLVLQVSASRSGPYRGGIRTARPLMDRGTPFIRSLLGVSAVIKRQIKTRLDGPAVRRANDDSNGRDLMLINRATKLGGRAGGSRV